MKTGTQDKVYGAVKAGKTRAEEIAESAGINKRQVYGNLRRLMSKGLVERVRSTAENSFFEYRLKSSKPCLLTKLWR